eukprot:gene2834-4940_t
MAMDAGMLRVTIEYAKDLKDGDMFGKADPYAVLKCGNQKFRTKTMKRAGTSPVWNETFACQIINENSIEIEVWDEDLISDDHLGTATIMLANVRTAKKDMVQAPVIRPKSRKQKGLIAINMTFEPDSSMPAKQAVHSQAHPSYSQAPPVQAASSYSGYSQAPPGQAAPSYSGYSQAPPAQAAPSYTGYSQVPPAQAAPSPYTGYSQAPPAQGTPSYSAHSAPPTHGYPAPATQGYPPATAATQSYSGGQAYGQPAPGYPPQGYQPQQAYPQHPPQGYPQQQPGYAAGFAPPAQPPPANYTPAYGGAPPPQTVVYHQQQHGNGRKKKPGVGMAVMAGGAGLLGGMLLGDMLFD